LLPAFVFLAFLGLRSLSYLLSTCGLIVSGSGAFPERRSAPWSGLDKGINRRIGRALLPDC
jgi:hypothetical protein